MKTDLAIKRTRDPRQRISASVADDPAKLVDYYIEMQKRFGARLTHAIGAPVSAPGVSACGQGRARTLDTGH
jgi:hypothetical protein